MKLYQKGIKNFE
uniref:Uncharacterized protein n=1 Tax=Arundo donax TaxID=35708 RepID=A0A0A9FF31_ARUDO